MYLKVLHTQTNTLSNQCLQPPPHGFSMNLIYRCSSFHLKKNYNPGNVVMTWELITEFDSRETSGWMQSLRHNGHPSILWPRSVTLNFVFQETVNPHRLALCHWFFSPDHNPGLNENWNHWEAHKIIKVITIIMGIYTYYVMSNVTGTHHCTTANHNSKSHLDGTHQHTHKHIKHLYVYTPIHCMHALKLGD